MQSGSGVSNHFSNVVELLVYFVFSFLSPDEVSFDVVHPYVGPVPYFSVPIGQICCILGINDKYHGQPKSTV